MSENSKQAAPVAAGDADKLAKAEALKVATVAFVRAIRSGRTGYVKIKVAMVAAFKGLIDAGAKRAYCLDLAKDHNVDADGKATFDTRTLRRWYDEAAGKAPAKGEGSGDGAKLISDPADAGIKAGKRIAAAVEAGIEGGGCDLDGLAEMLAHIVLGACKDRDVDAMTEMLADVQERVTEAWAAAASLDADTDDVVDVAADESLISKVA